MNAMFHRAKGTEVMDMLANMLEKSEQIDKNIAAVFEENEKDRFAKNRQRSKETKKKGKSFIWAFLSFFDSYFQYLFSTVVFRRRLVIFDRFFYDFLVSFEYLNISKASVFKNFVPSVRNKFLLICNPELAYKRKPENTKDFFRYTNKTFLRLAANYSIKVIDTSKQNPSIVLEKFISELDEV